MVICAAYVRVTPFNEACESLGYIGLLHLHYYSYHSYDYYSHV